ncbi:hypothetical protein BIV24_17115 [Streptomyces colonosanans]|uniref:Transglycosylase SLT domain-containing protein n=2 Tax=Streptomyces colonosanans TaxID=1428652 RepID=A0A1S2PAR1_9ACTN|nr:hypothetical protein BIV24_17115 [Streptomyces colonosanans]
MESAQQSLASAHRQAARSIAQANRQIEDAERGIVDAKQRVKDAEAAVVDAARRAADQRRQAAEAVERAERSLTDAKKAATQAEVDLTQARKDAAEQLAALDDKLTDGKLSQRDAALRVAEAEQELNRVRAQYNVGKANELDLERAQLGYDQAVQAQKEQSKAYEKLQQDAKAAKAAGVEGSDQVKKAHDRLKDAQQKVADEAKAVADAQRNAARVQVEAAKSVEDAQRRVSDALRGQADAQRALSDAVRNASDVQVQAADSIKSAERGVQSARLSSIDTTQKAASKTDAYREALAKLTPEQRRLYDSIAGPKGLTRAFKDWSASLQPDVLPLFTRGVDGAKASLPGLTPLVRAAADAVGVLMDKASAELKTPFWRGFKKDINASAKPAIVGLGVAFGNVLKGMAGIVDAFLPHMDGIAATMQRITKRFANWGANLKGSPEFERFLQYVKENGPLFARTIGDIAGAFLAIGAALSPLSGPLLQVIGGIAQSVGLMATNLPGLVPLVYGLFVVTRLWAIWQLAVNGAMAAFNVIMGLGPWGWIAIAIGGVVLAILALWKNCEWFRDAVGAVWGAIQKAAMSVRDWFAGPFVNLFTKTIPRTFQAVLDWVRKNWPWILGALTGPIGLAAVGIIKHWDQITSGISDAWRWLKSKVLFPIRDFFMKTVPGWGTTLSDKLVGAFIDATKGIKSAWDKIAGIASKPINFVIDAVYTHGIKAVWDKIAEFVGLPKLPKAPKLLDETPKFADGGPVFGGTPGKDSVRAWLMPGEFVLRTSSARKIGYGNLDHLNRTGELPGVPRFAGGGIVGDAWNWTKKTVGGAVSKGIDWAKTAGDLIAHPSKVWNRLVKPILDNVKKHLGVAQMGKVLTAIPVKMASGLKDKIVDAVTFSGGSGGGGNIGGVIPTGQRKSIITAAMAAAHVPPPGTVDAWLRGMNTLIMRESGWNANARNDWDSNARAGHPSQGLTQTIPSTFNAYVPASLRSKGILDPVANVAASIRYIVSRYGNIANVQQANANLPPKGYALGGRVAPTWFDSGGYLPKGLNLVANGTGRPEPVMTSQQWSDIRAAKSGASTPNVVVENHTYLGTREITDIVDHRVIVREEATARAINDGRLV